MREVNKTITSLKICIYAKIKNKISDDDMFYKLKEWDNSDSVELAPKLFPLFATPWTTVRQASLSINNSRRTLKLMSIESVMTSSHFILCHPFLLLPSIFPIIRVFSNELALHRWPKYWSFSFSISPFNEYSGLISFRIDCLDLLAVQETLKSLLQHHSSFLYGLTLSYMTTGKNIVLNRWTFVSKVISLKFDSNV